MHAVGRFAVGLAAAERFFIHLVQDNQMMRLWTSIHHTVKEYTIPVVNWRGRSGILLAKW